MHAQEHAQQREMSSKPSSVSLMHLGRHLSRGLHRVFKLPRPSSQSDTSSRDPSLPPDARTFPRDLADGSFSRDERCLAERFPVFLRGARSRDDFSSVVGSAENLRSRVWPFSASAEAARSSQNISLKLSSAHSLRTVARGENLPYHPWPLRVVDGGVGRRGESGGSDN